MSYHAGASRLSNRWKLSIPPGARERIVQRFPSGVKSRSKYYQRGKLIAEMLWEMDGAPAHGWEIRDGRKHGASIEWWRNGRIAFYEPFVDGLPHGVARHWDEEGMLLLETRYVRGTGVDLWCDLHNRSLSEETRLRHGKLHGARRYWNPDWRTVWQEEQYFDGEPHGIFRDWNREGRLRRGFPRYFVRGVRVDRRAYLRAAKTDVTLPVWRRSDNRPRRPLPPEIIGQPIHRESR